MFDIGWPELLVVAIVLIIVVGPKDLPPMLRAFGRTTKKLRGMASEFRGQFDDALREAELDDVKKTFDDARKLNPMQTIRDAVNPLKDSMKDSAKTIRSDLEKSVNSPSDTPPWQPKTEIPDATMKLPDGPPEVKSSAPAPAAKPDTKPAAKSTTAAKGSDKAKTPAVAKTAKSPAAAKATAPAKVATAKPAAAKAASAAKPAPKAKSTPAGKAPAAMADKPAAKKTTSAKTAPSARKPKQGEGKA